MPGFLQGKTKHPLHREFEAQGQRIVTDLFLDSDGEGRIVQRLVNMATGRTVWVAYDPDASTGVIP